MISKLGGDGAKFRAWLRPLLTGGMRAWRLPARPNKDILSKKAILLYNPSKTIDPKMGAAMASVVIANPYGIKVATKVKNKTRIDGQNDNNEDDDSGRNIGALPGSPSFRIFFQEHNQIDVNGGKFEAVKEPVSITCNAAPPEEMCVQKKVVKRKGMTMKMRRAVIWRKKAGMAVKKNTLKVKTSYHPSRSMLTATAAAADSHRNRLRP